MSLTNREAFQKLIATQNEEVDEKDSSVFQNENSFRMKVMSSPAPYSGPATANQDPELLNQTNIDSKYLFTARILDRGMAHEKFLEDPCNESVSPNAGAGSRLYALHTKVRLSHGGQMPQFQPGDIIESEMLAGDTRNLYDLQFCDMSGVKDVFQNQQISKAGACAKLGNLFGTGPGGGGGGFTGNAAGVPLTASEKLTQTAEEPKLITILKNKGYKTYDDGTINTIGIRSSNRVPDKFDDIMHLIWKKDGMWNDIAFQITADPGLKVLMGKYISKKLDFRYATGKGIAQLKEGQYVDAYKFGPHGGYPALQQKEKVTVYRDIYDPAAGGAQVLDWEKSAGGESTGRFGINIHRAAQNRIQQSVGAYSAGCQVFQSNADFQKALGIWNSTGQQRVTYTLLLWSDLTGADEAVASTERPWSTDPADGWLPAGTPPEEDSKWGTEGVDWGYTA